MKAIPLKLLENSFLSIDTGKMYSSLEQFLVERNKLQCIE